MITVKNRHNVYIYHLPQSSTYYLSLSPLVIIINGIIICPVEQFYRNENKYMGENKMAA